MKDRFQALLPHLLSIIIMLVVISAYFFPQFQGKELEQTDTIQGVAKVQAIAEYKEETGYRSLWNPGQFGGMPYLYNVHAKTNLLIYVKKVSRLGLNSPVGAFFSIAIFSYILFVFLGMNKWTALGLALATALSTNNVILWKTGHGSKLEALVYTPLILLGFLLLYDKRKYLLGGGVLSLGLGLNLFARHPQMTYYIFLALICYGVYELYRVIKSKEWKHFATATAVVAFSLLIAFGTSASKLWSMKEHKDASMRGGQILTTAVVDSGGKKSSGLDWDYAMQWSNGWKDVMATFIPRFAGGGSGENVSQNSESYKSYRFEKAPLYWGTLPGTEAPIYLGAAIIFLFLFSFLIIKSKHRWWILGAVIFTIFLSGGSNFAILNKPLFDYLPLYNSFRAPSSVLSVTVFFLPLMIAFGFNRLSALKRSKSGVIMDETVLRALYISLGITGGTCLAVALLGPSMLSFDSAGDARNAQQGIDISVFIADRKSALRSDALRSLFFILLCGGLFWTWIKGKIKTTILGIGVGIILLIDILGVDTRYLSNEDFKSKRSIAQAFQMRAVDQQIKNIEPHRGAYRVLDIPNFRTSMGSYYHNTIGGYDPVKTRRYEDLIDRHISKNNTRVLNMLNAKYIINSDAQGQLNLSQNPGALGNAWFVQRINSVNTPDEEIDALNVFDPAEEAVILTSEFEGYLEGLNIVSDSNATIDLKTYSPDRLEYQSSSNTEQLAVFSETWFGPNKGWYVTIDGQPANFIRANYDLRAMRIPSGSHEIIFEFKPNAYYQGEKISLFSSALLLLLLIGGIILYGRNEMFKKEPVKEAPKRKKKIIKKKKK